MKTFLETLLHTLTTISSSLAHSFSLPQFLGFLNSGEDMAVVFMSRLSDEVLGVLIFLSLVLLNKSIPPKAEVLSPPLKKWQCG